MNSARAGGRQAHAQFSGELGIGARHESSSFLMPHLNKPDLLLMRSQGLHDSIYTVTRYAENNIHAPVDQPFNENVSSSFGHEIAPLCFLICSVGCAGDSSC